MRRGSGYGGCRRRPLPFFSGSAPDHARLFGNEGDLKVKTTGCSRVVALIVRLVDVAFVAGIDLGAQGAFLKGFLHTVGVPGLDSE